MNLISMKHQFHDKLDHIYGGDEVQSLFDLCCEHYLLWKKLDQLRFAERSLTPLESDQLIAVLSQLELQKPIQYVLGQAHFCGLKIRVNESVLIPRQETEELVAWILDDFSQNNSVKMMDLCTGSGCIALALKSARPAFDVMGLDLSEAAIQLAKSNAISLKLEVAFGLSDVLVNPDFAENNFDFIVSNPPYVLNSEKSVMSQNVLDYEPHLALFVPDDDPLLFYRAIAQSAFKALKAGGSLFFEINENKGDSVIELIKNIGFLNPVIKKDLNGKDRMVKCFKPNA
jgi:release factor glutamine methyltransferase